MEKLYYSNPYLAKWESSVEDVIEKDNKYYVVLSETAFYPEGGGQPSDFGTIDGVELLGLSEVNGVIYHILPAPPKSPLVSCQLDFNRRFDLMQQHSGQHLLSAVFFNIYNGKTSSFHLGEDYISIDISLSDVSSELIKEIEDKANDYIYKNIEVINFIITPEEVDKYPLRKLPPTKEDIRIVEIQDVDFSPCCGTHVTRTGEIGIIKIIKHEKYKGITRIYFKCGNRALQDFQNKNEIISNLTKQFNAAENEILDRAVSLAQDLDAALKKIKDSKDKLAYYESLDIIKAAAANKIITTFTDKSFADIQLISKHILSLGSYLLILSSASDNRILFTHDGNFEINCGKIFKEHLSTFKGKGGGSDKQAQGGFQNPEDMNKFVEFLKEMCGILPSS
ncbi:MAG: alanyl-tRNA editing protein [Clostridiales bacterium]|jgi:alanyl-tRNA synthetase|nr:alanyl-tRNA editing protein [Clostridiales bacterium]